MSAIFDRDRVSTLPGKQIRPLMASLTVAVRLGLWRDYAHWLPEHQQLDFWYDSRVLADNPITVTVSAAGHTLPPQVFEVFGTKNIMHQFEDHGPEPVDLKISLEGLGRLPVRDDTGVFVCGMVEIVSVQLQEIELVHLLPNTMHGVDTEIVLPMTRPVYPWLVAHAPEILGKKWQT